MGLLAGKQVAAKLKALDAMIEGSKGRYQKHPSPDKESAGHVSKWRSRPCSDLCRRLKTAFQAVAALLTASSILADSRAAD